MHRRDVRPGPDGPATGVVDIVAVDGKDRADIDRLYGEMYRLLGHPGPPAGWIDEVVAQALRGDRGLFIAKAACVALGFIDFKLVRYHAATESTFCRIFDVFVKPEARQRGIGRRLWLQALHTAKDRGADSVELNVLPANEGAQAFWQRQGFRGSTRSASDVTWRRTMPDGAGRAALQGKRRSSRRARRSWPSADPCLDLGVAHLDGRARRHCR